MSRSGQACTISHSRRLRAYSWTRQIALALRVCKHQPSGNHLVDIPKTQSYIIANPVNFSKPEAFRYPLNRRNISPCFIPLSVSRLYVGNRYTELTVSLTIVQIPFPSEVNQSLGEDDLVDLALLLIRG